MSNMSYCRFINTRTDLNDCLDSLRHDERMSEMEVREGRNMFEEFLTFCQEYGIIDDYDGQLEPEGTGMLRGRVMEGRLWI